MQLQQQLRLLTLGLNEEISLFSCLFLCFDQCFVCFIQLQLVVFDALDKALYFFLQHGLFKLGGRLMLVQSLDVLLVEGLRRFEIELQLSVLVLPKLKEVEFFLLKL